jgi:hypothetical protein
MHQLQDRGSRDKSESAANMYAVKKIKLPPLFSQRPKNNLLIRHTSQHHHDCIGLLLHVRKQHTSRKLPALPVCKNQFPGSCCSHTEKRPGSSKTFGCCTWEDVHEHANVNFRVHHADYSSHGRTGSTSTLSCVVVPVSRTGSRCAPGHCILRRDYSSSGLHRLYYAYAVHPDALSRHSTSHRSVALALTMRPVTASRGATTRRTDCTGSTVPMPCIQTRRLDARLLVSRSHWLSPCAQSFCCAS